MIALDTVCEGGVTGPCADGNVDDPQFRWLEGELEAATAADQLVIVFSHHAPSSLTANVPDEAAPACTAPDSHGHDVNPGCDVDPRTSTPIHLEEDMVALLHRFPHVIAWVAGHSHVNDVTPYPGPDGHGFWSVKVAAEADWPQQSRLLQLFDNHDGTLSLFGTIVDHASEATAPAPGTDAASLAPADLASIGRTLSYNDGQTGGRECAPDPCGEGAADDRNVELLIADPRRGRGRTGHRHGPGQGQGQRQGQGQGQAAQRRQRSLRQRGRRHAQGRDPARHLRLRPAPRQGRRRQDQAPRRRGLRVRRARARPRLRPRRRERTGSAAAAAATSPSSTARTPSRAASGSAAAKPTRAADEPGGLPVPRYSCGRAMRRWSRASSSTEGSTPCSSATSRSERPDSAAALTISAARS